jgi:hypothetical protein
VIHHSLALDTFFAAAVAAFDRFLAGAFLVAAYAAITTVFLIRFIVFIVITRAQHTTSIFWPIADFKCIVPVKSRLTMKFDLFACCALVIRIAVGGMCRECLSLGAGCRSQLWPWIAFPQNET